ARRVNAGGLLDQGQILRGSASANLPVGAGGKRRFVDHAVVDSRLDSIRLAPLLGEDVVNVDLVIEEGLRLDRLAGAEVARAVAHEERVETLIRRAVARAQREQPIRLEARLLDRAGFHTLSAYERHDLH